MLETSDPEATRRTIVTLLEAAGLEAPAETVDTYVTLYPGLRTMLDAMSDLPEVRYEEPALIYSAAVADAGGGR